MNMFHFTIPELKDFATNDKTFHRGSNYFHEGRVVNVSYRSLDDTYVTNVLGSETYTCEFKLVKNDNRIVTECNCEAYYTYVGDCKHIIASLLELKQREDNNINPFHRRLQQVKRSRMVEVFQQSFQPEVNLIHTKQQLLHFEYDLHFLSFQRNNPLSSGIDLKLRVGIERLYVVKDIEEFLIALIEQYPYSFTTRFSYDPELHLVSEKDKAIATYLLTLYRIQDVEAFSSYSRQNRRSFRVPDVAMPSLLEHLTGQQVVASSEWMNKSTVQITTLTNEHPFSFNIIESKQRNVMELQLDNPDEFIFAPAGYQVLYHNGILYQLDEQQAKQIESISASLMNSKTIDLIPPTDLEAFFSYVIPSLRRLGEVTLPESLANNVETKPLQATLQLDLIDDILTGDLTFRYGEHVRNPFLNTIDSEITTIITREMEKESTIMSYLSQTAFTTREGSIYLSDWDNILSFLFEQLPELQMFVDVFTTSAVRKIIYTPEKAPTVEMDINPETNWLDLSFSIDGIPEDEIVSILQAINKQATYYRLSSGAFIHLQNEQFHSVKDVLETLSPAARTIGADMSVPLYKAFSLDQEQKGTRISKQLHHLLSNVEKPEFTDFKVPENLHADLRDYQITGFRWLKTLSAYGLSGILADDMGLGKTIQTIAYLLSEKENNHSFKSLIITPASVIYNWEKELIRFAPSLNVRVISGPKSVRQQMIHTDDDVDIWITSYPLIQRDIELFDHKSFSAVILDESQYIKNDTAKTTKAVRAIQTERTFALSGTPIENRLEELYTILHTVMPGILGTKKTFKELTNDTIAKRVRPFILRRLKKDVLTELPDKMETIQYTDLSDDQKKLYLAQVKQLTENVDDAVTTNQFQAKRMEILAGLTRLRQICCHPNLILDDKPYRSGKFDRLLEYIDEALAAGQRIVIFSQFTSMLHIIETALKQKELDYHYLDGKTPAKKRVEMADRFNEGEKSLFLISLKAGGTGLNLIGGDTVILYDSWWNPAVEEQAADRVYRYGQTKNVQVVKLISNGTIEEKILELHKKKKALIEEIIQPGEQSIQSLTAEDIKELLSVT